MKVSGCLPCEVNQPEQQIAMVSGTKIFITLIRVISPNSRH